MGEKIEQKGKRNNGRKQNEKENHGRKWNGKRNWKKE